MNKSITVLGIMDKDSGLLWNRVHKKFMPLTQNTLLIRDIGQYRRPKRAYGPFHDMNITPVEIEIKVKEQNNDRRNKN